MVKIYRVLLNPDVNNERDVNYYIPMCEAEENRIKEFSKFPEMDIPKDEIPLLITALIQYCNQE